MNHLSVGEIVLLGILACMVVFLGISVYYFIKENMEMDDEGYPDTF